MENRSEGTRRYHLVTPRPEATTQLAPPTPPGMPEPLLLRSHLKRGESRNVAVSNNLLMPLLKKKPES